jgi:hypothetical protein
MCVRLWEGGLMQIVQALNEEKERLTKQLATINKALVEFGEAPERKKARFSPATRAKMAKAKKAWWARKKAKAPKHAPRVDQ